MIKSKQLIKIFLIVICLVSLKASGQESSIRTIYLMRAKQFYGSGAGMNININDQLFHNLKGGTRVILKVEKSDTLNFQVIYPPMKKYKSHILTILPGSEDEIFIDAYYWGTGYNPSMLITHERPEFNIEITKMDSVSGKVKFNLNEKFKDSFDEIQIKNVP